MKNLITELILPAFWLFIFIISSNKEEKVYKLKAKNESFNNEKQYISASGKIKSIEKSKESKISNPIYLSGF